MTRSQRQHGNGVRLEAVAAGTWLLLAVTISAGLPNDGWRAGFLEFSSVLFE